MVVAPERASRPESFKMAEAHAGARAECPLCEGREGLTPPETYAVRPGGGPPDSPGWLVRSVPNKYPVFDGNGPEGSAPPERGSGEPDLFSSTPATGAHEVIVHAPQHVPSLAELGAEQVTVAVEAWRDRLAAHSDARYVHIIVNEGLIAGASLEHSHAQLYALPFVPIVVAREREAFTAHNTRTMGGCLLCDIVQEEVRRRERVIAVDDTVVLLAPYASRLPYELRLVPREHSPTMTDARAGPLLHDALLRLARVLGPRPAYNLWLRTAPRGADHFHWHIDLVPRLTHLAGLELGAGVAVNIYPPERAAEDLRG